MLATQTISETLVHLPMYFELGSRVKDGFLGLLRMAIAIIVRFSDWPLKLSVVIGFALSFFAAFIALLRALFRLFGIFMVPGWTSTVLSVWFLSGLIMATLGVHGFYLGRVFAQVKRRPRIVLETRTLTPETDR